MKNLFIYFFAYIASLVGWVLFIIIILDLFNFIYVKDAGMLAFFALPFIFFYHKYKPMEFKRLLKKTKQKLFY